jgi:hypothetical protein
MSSKGLQLQLHDFLEHLMTCSTNSTKFSGARATPNRAKVVNPRTHCIYTRKIKTFLQYCNFKLRVTSGEICAANKMSRVRNRVKKPHQGLPLPPSGSLQLCNYLASSYAITIT